MQTRIFPLLLLTGLFLILVRKDVSAQLWFSAHSVGSQTGKNHFSYQEIPDPIVELHPVSILPGGFSFQWQQAASPLGSFTDIPGATQATLSFTSPLTATTYFRRKTTYNANSTYIFSNVVKLSVVSVNWEDRNYIREHDILVPGVDSWQEVDQLEIGEKLQTTSYTDALGRSLQQVSRGTATPEISSGTWGDLVQFSEYDPYGRQPKQYLPFTSASQPGKFKTDAKNEQSAYFQNNYNQGVSYSEVEFDKSPLGRPRKAWRPGDSWSNSSGLSSLNDINTTTDYVQIFKVSSNDNDPPVHDGAYLQGSLLKITGTDESGRKLIQFYNKNGQLILNKVQLADNPVNVYDGWICTYYVYDAFGQLRFELQPEAVNYLKANGWSFSGTNGQTVLNGLCFQYRYDDKGRNIWKKAPGADPLLMIYDVRNRLVLAQDGNQAQKSPAEWTATIYDHFDRPTISTLFRTSLTESQLRSNVNLLGLNSIVSQSDLNNPAICTVLSYQYYDNYDFAGAIPFDPGFDNIAAYSNSDPNVMPITKSTRINSYPTGNKVRILGTNTFLTSTSYFDKRGRLIQIQSENIRGGIEVTTLQYHFAGWLLSEFKKHNVPGTDFEDFAILTKNIHDKLGRTTQIQKRIGENEFRDIVSYEYDDIGRLKKKRLAPKEMEEGGSEIESLTYSYNIHNQITGINQDYALKTSGYDKWAHYFGIHLGYENGEGHFTNSNLSGQVTGVIWNSQGDDAQRRYDFVYDNAGRLLRSDYKERTATNSSWSNSLMDFSVTGDGGKILYDLNGNLISMIQKGVIAGENAPVIVDKLQYGYASLSNRLTSVTDQTTINNLNGTQGDFKDGSNGSSPDYVYDANGNIVIDLNKDVKDIGGTGNDGIRYNFLDKPEEIRINGKGTIKIVYSADGGKLQRVFIPESGDAKITTYIGEFVYQETDNLSLSTPAPFGSGGELAFIGFEEGRIRVMQPVDEDNGLDQLKIEGNIELPGGRQGAFDYFITDYQANVRMILTEQVHEGLNQCTMETARASQEQSIFGQSGSANEVVQTRFPASSIPQGGWQNQDIGSQVSRLSKSSGKTIGPNAFLKVMAGDEISAFTQYYHQDDANNGTGSNLIEDLVSSLFSVISGSNAASSDVKNGLEGISGQLGNNVPFENIVAPDASNPDGTHPKAYLTILFFDERFRFVEEGSLSLRVEENPGYDDYLSFMNIRAPRNGYAFVYLSNESDEAVYFDNFQVRHNRGRIIEENHYYSFGLRISAISSTKLGDDREGMLNNDYEMQGMFSEMDADIGWNDFALRNYDPQIGRWVQQDPYQQFASPYVGMGNDPINIIDPSGGIGVPCPGTSQLTIFFMKAGDFISKGLSATTGIRATLGIVTSAGRFGANMYNNSKQFKLVSRQLEGSLTTSVGEDDGEYRGALLTYDKSSNKLILTANIVVYSSLMSKAEIEYYANMLQKKIIEYWSNPVLEEGENKPGGRIGSNTEVLEIVFDVRVHAKTYSEANDMIKRGEWDETFSFFQLGTEGRSFYQSSDAMRHSFFNICDLETGAFTSGAHEFGHVLAYFLNKKDENGNELRHLFGAQFHSDYKVDEQDFIMGEFVSDKPTARRVFGVEYSRVKGWDKTAKKSISGFTLTTHNSRVILGYKFKIPPKIAQ